MTERLLQFIWQFQYFNKHHLQTIGGEEIVILHAGDYNRDAGPDFSFASIRIGNNVWMGTVELHLKTSDWSRHMHDENDNYKNVILHVVYENDCAESKLPVLELQSRISFLLCQRYEELMQSAAFIPCQGSIDKIESLKLISWKERLVVERVLRKSDWMENILKDLHYHWEEAFWWILARNFGIRVNAEAFESLARSVSLKILTKQKHQVLSIEAILFGQAGLLSGTFAEGYPIMLQKEYRFLQKKHGLQPIHIPIHFLRMRPGNFPSVRLAQLAVLIHNSQHLFSRVRDASSLDEIRQWLNSSATDYWNTHYRFDEVSPFQEKRLGTGMIDNILINTILPMLFAYGRHQGDVSLRERAISWLAEVAPETNGIINGFRRLGLEVKNACDSQALIELKHEYCDRRRCLECGIGNAILGKSWSGGLTIA